MLDIKFIRENPEKVKQGAQNKGANVDVDKLLEIDKKRRELLAQTEQLKAEQNKITKQLGDRAGTDPVGTPLMEQAKALKEKVALGEEKLKELEPEFDALMRKIPNLPADDVPVGKDDSENQVKGLGKIKEKPQFDFEPKTYEEIGERLSIIDTERGAKVAGARFYYLKGEAALIEFALINLALQKLVAKGFIPVMPPVMIKREMAKGTGYFEQTDEKEAYYIKDDDLFLVGTSEQSLITMHADEILPEAELPKMYAGFSTCFRREAGSYGKDTKGIMRVHQFDKIEMVIFAKPEDSPKYLELLAEIERELMDDLGLHYQIIDICTGDLGMPAIKKYDIETWMPGQNRYRETHSTSNCSDFQARRLNIRCRDKQGNLRFLHTLNGTAFAIPRLLIAILENYQQKDGSIKMPKVLQKYLGFEEIRK